MIIRKKSKLAIVALIAVAVALALTFAVIPAAFPAINVNQNVSSSGTITTSPNVGVFSDSACTVNMTSLNWGTIAAGSSKNLTAYIKNTGTGTMTLNLAASNWSPSSAGTYLTVSWNQQGTQLTAGQSVAATITLTVASTITGFTTFSNTITITGTG
ncbi:MAG: hypothetical protein ABSG33_11940 [Candidatus Bathyarchaeia archaeon]|jgi:hypothetical protein